jgi:recombination DNA repair RAD52 pathway protein
MSKHHAYSDLIVKALDEPLNRQLISTRRIGSQEVQYVDRGAMVYQANRIFGYGNWSYEVVSLELVVLHDPVSQEVVGLEYDAQVRIDIAGGMSLLGYGIQTVAVWDVTDYIATQREKRVAGLDKELSDVEREEAATKILSAPVTAEEKRNARAIIAQAHKQARKGAIADALKKGFQTQGEQFGNGLGRKKPLPHLLPLAPSIAQIVKWADTHYDGGFVTLQIDLDFPENQDEWSEDQCRQAYHAISMAVREARQAS